MKQGSLSKNHRGAKIGQGAWTKVVQKGRFTVVWLLYVEQFWNYYIFQVFQNYGLLINAYCEGWWRCRNLYDGSFWRQQFGIWQFQINVLEWSNWEFFLCRWITWMFGHWHAWETSKFQNVSEMCQTILNRAYWTTFVQALCRFSASLWTFLNKPNFVN